MKTIGKHINKNTNTYEQMIKYASIDMKVNAREHAQPNRDIKTKENDNAKQTISMNMHAIEHAKQTTT